MKKMNNRKGFTLAELLIVVAIIAVLVAIAIPVFTTQLEKAREATDLANIRSAYAEAMTEYITNPTTVSKEASIKQKDADWHIDHVLTTRFEGTEGTITLDPVAPGASAKATVTVTAPAVGSTVPTVTVTFS